MEKTNLPHCDIENWFSPVPRLGLFTPYSQSIRENEKGKGTSFTRADGDCHTRSALAAEVCFPWDRRTLSRQPSSNSSTEHRRNPHSEGDRLPPGNPTIAHSADREKAHHRQPDQDGRRHARRVSVKPDSCRNVRNKHIGQHGNDVTSGNSHCSIRNSTEIVLDRPTSAKAFSTHRILDQRTW